MVQRRLKLPKRPEETFFLWGPRQTGKSSLLRATYPDAVWYDLLETERYLRLRERPSLLREELQALGKPRLVVIDEVQKVPLLLDEVHALIEREGWTFALCGSSARKVRRGHANLLGGRAIRHELFGLVSAELGAEFDLVRMLNHGYLPRHYLGTSPFRRLRAYVDDYLKEEIAAEGLARNLAAYSGFLSAAALSDGEIVNYTTIARDCGVSSPTVKEYFQILVDTLLGRYLPAYSKRPKRRLVQSPKFYFADVGVVNLLAKRGALQPGSELFGKAFENWVLHELAAHVSYDGARHELAYWRLTGGTEVDVVVDDIAFAIEAKSSARVTDDHMKGLRELAKDHPRVKRRIVVCLEERARRTDDGIEILPFARFTERLWSGDLLA